MSEKRGGGASKTTDIAAGTSSATDVSIREYLSDKIDGVERRLSKDIGALKEITVANRASDQEAVKLALSSQKELAAKHNDLIRQMEKKDAAYIARDEYNSKHEELENRLDREAAALSKEVGRVAKFQYYMAGGVLVLSFIGVTNLVKIWTGV